jgi:hypothetical protein
LLKYPKSELLFAEISKIKTAFCWNIANQNSFLLNELKWFETGSAIKFRCSCLSHWNSRWVLRHGPFPPEVK